MEKLDSLIEDSRKCLFKDNDTYAVRDLTFCRLPKVAIISSNFQFKTNDDARKLKTKQI